MHSRVEVVADVTAEGRTVMARVRTEGAFAARVTGPGQVHLVGTAAGPLGGDEVDVRVVVRAGARLVLRGTAATLALPNRGGEPARLSADLQVEDGASLVQDLPPLVVCHRARLHAETRLTLAGSAAADLTEVVVLGRHGEHGGDWTGRLSADRDGAAVLRATQRSDILRLGPGSPRTILTRFVTRRAEDGWAEAVTSAGAVLCPLATGDVLITATGAAVPAVLAQAAALLADPQSLLTSPEGPTWRSQSPGPAAPHDMTRGSSFNGNK
ncbi:MAG TPA: urease accessory protein UreD [Kineosporiaceae bacterium]